MPGCSIDAQGKSAEAPKYIRGGARNVSDARKEGANSRCLFPRWPSLCRSIDTDPWHRSTRIARCRKHGNTRNCLQHQPKPLRWGRCFLLRSKRLRLFPKLRPCEEDGPGGPSLLLILLRNRVLPHTAVEPPRLHRTPTRLPLWMEVQPARRKPPTSSPTDSQPWISLISCMRRETSSISRQQYKTRTKRMMISPRDSPMPWLTMPSHEDPHLSDRSRSSIGDRKRRLCVPPLLKFKKLPFDNRLLCTNQPPSGLLWSRPEL